MRLFRGIHSLSSKAELMQSAVVTIGAFDGVHKGHQAVLKHVMALAKQNEALSAIVTFEPLPREYFAPLSAPARLMSFREKFEACRQFGLDAMLLVPFNDRMRNTSAESFIQSVLVNGFNCKHCIIGDDFKFGRDGQGDFTFLQAMGMEYGFKVEAMPTQLEENQRISSSLIRQLLEAGDFVSVKCLLGRDYEITGRVVYGKQLGRTLGLPTANVELHRLRTAMSGVYVAQTRIADNEDWLPAVVNIGTRPTVEDSIKAILEVHLIGQEHIDLYGKRISTRFIQKIRDEKKFSGLDELKSQIQNDIQNAKQLLGL